MRGVLFRGDNTETTAIGSVQFDVEHDESDAIKHLNTLVQRKNVHDKLCRMTTLPTQQVSNSVRRAERHRLLEFRGPLYEA